MSRHAYAIKSGGGAVEVTMDMGAMDRIPQVVGSDYIRQYAHEKIAEYADPYVPMRSGALVSSAEATADSLIYPMPYANAQYRGASKNGTPFNYSTARHPLADSHWIERGLSGRTAELANEIRGEIVQAAKRRYK
jgi:hypothetical protein